MPDIKRIALSLLAGIAGLVQSGGAPALNLRPKEPGWFVAAQIGSLFVFLGVMFALVTVMAGEVSWIAALFGLGAITIGAALLRLAFVLRARR